MKTRFGGGVKTEVKSEDQGKKEDDEDHDSKQGDFGGADDEEDEPKQSNLTKDQASMEQVCKVMKIWNDMRQIY